MKCECVKESIECLCGDILFWNFMREMGIFSFLLIVVLVSALGSWYITRNL